MTNYPKLCELKSANKNQSTVIINQEHIFMQSIKWIIFNCQFFGKMFCEVVATMAGKATPSSRKNIKLPKPNPTRVGSEQVVRCTTNSQTNS